MVTLIWRDEVTAEDVRRVEQVCAATGFFTPAEILMAGELVEARLEEGAAAGYEFILAADGDAIAGYTCYGAIDGTESAYDLYWIAVDPARQGGGLGRKLIEHTETAMRKAGGSRYYAETSSTEKYAPTRNFYLRAGFREVANIADFYRPGDGKVIFERLL